jgi:arylsulfatase B
VCFLAGINPADEVAAAHGLPPIDSEDLWPLLTGNTASTKRKTLVAILDAVWVVNVTKSSAVLVGDRWKYIHGPQPFSYWQGPEFPNSSAPYGQLLDPKLWHFCEPCVFDLIDDAGEHNNVFLEHPEVVLTAEAALHDARETQFQPESRKDDAACNAAVQRWGNFYGPWQ